jgi:hypothetical protein
MAKITNRPPAYCKDCGILFAAPIDLNNVRAVFHNSTTNCPQCQRSVPILDGTYNAYAGRFEMILDATISLEARMAVLRIVADVQENKIALPEAKKRAEKVDRRLGRLFDISHWSDEARAQFFGAILIAGATLGAGALNAAAVRYASPAAVVVQAARASPPDLRSGLLSGTVQTPVSLPAPSALQFAQHQKAQDPHRNTRAKTGAEHHARKKGPH